MKTISTLKTTILFLALAAVSFSSCKKDSDKKVSKGKFATVTVKRYAFDGGAAAEFKSTAAVIAVAGPIFTFTAVKDGLKESITIALYGKIGVGTYSLDQDNASGNGAVMFKDFNKSSDPTYAYSTGEQRGDGGEVKITKLTDTEIEGTFFIVAHNSAGKGAYAEQGSFSGAITTVK
ncbi:MAG: hypothetical protein EOP47_18570 [Sphingobacteriaceae bacterium]|nr:MAG: hypothetical protein EOP47_18570 [Sphingobacteriaceae bacterium]